MILHNIQSYTTIGSKQKRVCYMYYQYLTKLSRYFDKIHILCSFCLVLPLSVGNPRFSSRRCTGSFLSLSLFFFHTHTLSLQDRNKKTMQMIKRRKKNLKFRLTPNPSVKKKLFNQNCYSCTSLVCKSMFYYKSFVAAY